MRTRIPASGNRLGTFCKERRVEAGAKCSGLVGTDNHLLREGVCLVGGPSRLHALVQDCSRAIAAYASPALAFSEIERIVASATGALSAEIATAAKNIIACEVAVQAFKERRVCIRMRGEVMLIAAPVKNASRVFGVLVASYGNDVDRAVGEHATSDLVNAVAQAVGNALALAEKVPQGSAAVLSLEAYQHYLRAHFELHRSFHVPFTLALYDLRDYPASSRISQAVGLRSAIRQSDGVFRITETAFVVLLAGCPSVSSHVAVKRIEESTGCAPHALLSPRRNESFQRLLTRSTALTPENEPVAAKIEGRSR